MGKRYFTVGAISYSRNLYSVVDVGLTAWEREFGTFLDGVYKYYPRNLDVNSGDPLGASVCQVSARDGHRTTASSAYLSDVPSNLTILTDLTIEKILFDQDSARGVTTNKGKSSKTDSSHSQPSHSAVANIS